MPQHAFGQNDNKFEIGRVHLPRFLQKPISLDVYKSPVGDIIHGYFGEDGGYPYFFRPSGEENFHELSISGSPSWVRGCCFVITPCGRKAAFAADGGSGQWCELNRTAHKDSVEWRWQADSHGQDMKAKIAKGEVTLYSLPRDHFISFAAETFGTSMGKGALVVTESRYGNTSHRVFFVDYGRDGRIEEFKITKCGWDGRPDLGSPPNGHVVYVYFGSGHKFLAQVKEGGHVHALYLNGINIPSMSDGETSRLAGKIPGVPERWTPLVTPSGRVCDNGCRPIRQSTLVGWARYDI